MKRYFYSFHFAEGPSKGEFITTSSFLASSIRDANFLASCYCFVLTSARKLYRSVRFKFLMFEKNGK